MSTSHEAAQQTQIIRIAFVQLWTSVDDVGPTLHKCYTNVLCFWKSSNISSMLADVLKRSQRW